MNTTKQEINYRLPQECCMNCIHSYMNTYGDSCCKLLESTDLVDEGGTCDMYQFEQPHLLETQIIDSVIEEEAIEKTCVNCNNSYYDGDIPKCSIDSDTIENINTACNAWEESYDG